MISWLMQSTVEISLVIGLLIILNPLLRKFINAQFTYYLWLLPVLALINIDVLNQTNLIENITIVGQLVSSVPSIQVDNIINQSSSFNLIGLWLVGFVLFSTYRALSYIRFKRHLNNSANKTSVPSTIMNYLFEQLGFKVKSVYQGDVVTSPFVSGLLFPKVYVPIGFFENNSLENQQWILHHEFTHIKRMDTLAYFVFEVVRSVFWFNPLIHLAYKQFCQDQELACDYLVLKNCTKQQRVQYAQVMFSNINQDSMMFVLPFYSFIQERFKMLKKHKPSKTKTVMASVSVIFVSVILLTTSPNIFSKMESKAIDFNFNKIILSEAVKIIIYHSGKELVLLDPFPEVELSIYGKDIDSILLLDDILNCNGFEYKVDGEKILVSKLKSSTDIRKSCDELEFRKFDT